MTDTIQALQSSLSALKPTVLEVQDESHLHAGHAGNTGGGHYNIVIVSEAFDGLTLIKRHRLVYDTVGDLMKTAIHALSINAKTPTEYRAN